LFAFASNLICWSKLVWWGNLKMFTIVLQLLHLQGKVHNPCTTKKKADGEISIHVDQILAYIFLTSICCYMLRWNCMNEVDGVGTIVSQPK
jgi:hypothetical protein